MRYKPLRDRILVRPIDLNRETAKVVENGVEYYVKQTVGNHSLIVPDVAIEKEPNKKGVIVEIGKNTSHKEQVVSIGDVIIYGKFAGTEIKLDDEQFIILREEDILLIEE